MFKGLSEVLGESLGGWVLAGAAAIIFAPTLTNIVRGVAVGTARGVLSLAEGGSVFASNVREGWENIVTEAKSQKGMTTDFNTNTVVGAGAGGALGASIGGGMAGAMGATVGGGLGGVVGATVANSVGNTTNHKENHTDPANS